MFVKLLLLFPLFLFSYEISAKEVIGSLVDKKSIFKKDVVIRDKGSVIKADKVIAFLDSKNKPYKFEASGNVRFKIELKNKIYKGRADLIIVDLKKEVIDLISNVKVFDNSGNMIEGEYLFLDRKNGIIHLKGKGKKPIKIIYGKNNRS